MKRISVCYWMIFTRNDEGIVDDSPQPQPPVSKEFLKKIQGHQTKVYIYANEGPEPMRVEGREPEFQKEIILQAMKEQLDKEKIPYFGVAIDKPYAEINIDRKITEHKNWESVLVNKLQGKKRGD